MSFAKATNLKKEEKQQKANGSGAPDSSGLPLLDFHDLSVTPTIEDVLQSNHDVYLRKAILDGPYEDDKHYLDVIFRLMREDLYRPLRDGIQQVRAHNGAGKTDLYVYTNVRMINLEMNKQSSQIQHNIKMHKRDKKRLMHKRLMFGSLVCLSADGFREQFLFGTIVDRNALPKEGQIGIALFADQTDRMPPAYQKLDYCMVESGAFYEAYKHVLTALQAIPRDRPIPFSKYFVHLEREVEIPTYQVIDGECKLDFTCLLTDDAKRKYYGRNAKCASNKLLQRFNCSDFGLDQSQFDALAHALCSELAIIQLRDIILLSLVRSLHPENKIGFLKNPNRVCVAMSRAKKGFYVLGNFDYLAENCDGEDKDLWRNIRRSVHDADAIGAALPIRCQLHGDEQMISTINDFMVCAPEGGCQRACNTVLNCGHVCKLYCHAYDARHEYMKCMERCRRRCTNGHQCVDNCFQECPECLVEIEKKLRCGHKIKAACWKPENEIKCMQKCVRMLECGHPCKGNCNEPCLECKVPVKKTLLCGHTALMECSQMITLAKCVEEVEKEWPMCGHFCKVACNVQPDDVPCMKPCGTVFAKKEGGCGHTCKGTCGQCRNGRLHIECTENCERTLVCGHQCTSKCCRVCPPCTKPCETVCSHSQCGLLLIPGFAQQKKLRESTKQCKGRQCGEKCPPCPEKCANSCPHRECSEKCGEPCNVSPCDEPCDKLLECAAGKESPEQHRCAGMCGEECIQICRICDPEKFAEEAIFMNSSATKEETDDARFVLLKECGHIVEVKELDQWIRGQMNAYSPAAEGNNAFFEISCPKCKIPIRYSMRYMAILNKHAKQIEMIKEKILGEPKDQLRIKWTELKAKIEKNLGAFAHGPRQFDPIIFQFNKIKEVLKPKVENNVITAQFICTMENVERLFKTVNGLLGQLQNAPFQLMPVAQLQFTDVQAVLKPFGISIDHLSDNFLFDLELLVNRLFECMTAEKKNVRRIRPEIAEPFLLQLSSELLRSEFLLNLFGLFESVEIEMNASRVHGELRTILTKLHGPESFIACRNELYLLLYHLYLSHYNEKRMSINKLVDIRGGSDKFLEIKRAFGANVDQWTICSKGHPFNIRKHGKAQLSECPECVLEMETNGAQQHQLEAGTCRSTLNLLKDDPLIARVRARL